MRTFAIFVAGAVLGASSTPTFAQAPEAASGLTPRDWASIRAAYAAGRHAASEVDGGFRAYNPGQQWAAHFDGRGFTVEPDAGGWSWGLELERWGFAGHERSLPDAADVRAEGQRVAYDWDADLTEWYVNDARGLEHGYTLHQRPAGAVGNGDLTFTLALRGDLCAVVTGGGRNVRFQDGAGAAVLDYAGLKVFDADGREFTARFAPTSAGLRLSIDELGARYPLTIDPVAQQAYLKASNPGGDRFGDAVSLSGNTVVIGAFFEDSAATGVNGDGSNNTVFHSGAAYVFVRDGASWSQQAYLKASNTEIYDYFGSSVSVSGDTIIVGANGEDSAASGVNGDQQNNDTASSGAAYVFVRSGTIWSQQAYLKASDPHSSVSFGHSVSVSGDTVVVGTGYGDVAYIFVRNGSAWSQQSILTGAGTEPGDFFGRSVSISGDTVVAGAFAESSNVTGVNGNEANNDALASGAAYVFVRSGATWSQQAYLKASNAEAGDHFGGSVSVSADTIVVGAVRESSSATGVNGDEGNENASLAGAAYVFVRNGTAWSQHAYLKASNTEAFDYFGTSVSASDDIVVVATNDEDSAATGVNGDGSDNSALNAGAAYVFRRIDTIWVQSAYLKASNAESFDNFGVAASVSGDTVVVGAYAEKSNSPGVNGDQGDNSTFGVGAAYVFEIAAPLVGTYCQGKPNSQGCIPAMAWVGVPSASDANAFLVTCTDVLNFKPGLLAYGFAPAAIPFQDATLCAQPPLHRVGLQNSLGNLPPPSDCSGNFAFDMNAHIQAGIDPALAAGTLVYAQYFGRDPGAPFGTSLSNAVLFEIAP